MTLIVAQGRGNSYSNSVVNRGVIVNYRLSVPFLSSVVALVSALPAYSQNFTDVTGYWAEQYVSALAQRQIIGGFPDNTFKPNAPITRAQFAAIVVRAFNLPLAGGSSTFVDVPANYWAAPAIRAVSNSGLVTGFPDGSFRPEERITRGQALIVLTKALGNKATPNPAALDRYADKQAVPDWALDSTSRAANAGIIVNFPNANVIAPNNIATRGEVAALMYQTLFRMGDRGLPPITIGTVGGPAPTPPVAQVLTIDNIQLNRDPRSAFTAGDELIVTAVGTPQASASFVIAGINQSQPIAMREIRPGVYEGSYTIRRTDGQLNTSLAVTLAKQGFNSISRDFHSSIAINSTGPDETPRTLKPEIVGLKNNDPIAFPAEIRGRTIPEARVQLVVDAVRNVAGVISVTQRLLEQATIANAQGRFILQVPRVATLTGASAYRLRFSATNPQTNQTEVTELILRPQ